MKRTPRMRKPRPAAADPAEAPAGEAEIERAEQQPDQGKGWATDTEDRRPAEPENRTNQTDIERALEENRVAVETPRQDHEAPGGFLEPERPGPGRGG